jgi:acetyl esterase/lipase
MRRRDTVVTILPRPDFDPELKAGLAIVGGFFPPTVTPDLIDHMRKAWASPPIDETLEARPVEREDVTIGGHLGDPITVSLLRPQDVSERRPAILFAHSGGFMFGDRFSGVSPLLHWVERLGGIFVTPEYRLAPEFPDPYPREDMYATLEWVATNAERLGVRRDRILVVGASCGGGLAAGLALAARDRGGPVLCGQALDYPMLDDRGLALSTRQFDGVGVWDRVSNETGWTALLGSERGGPNVSEYAAPARATDLRGLPPTFIDVGTAEIFRDEAVDYATALWEAGGDAELHVWAGGFHAFDIFAPHTALSRGMIRTRDAWVERMIED